MRNVTGDRNSSPAVRPSLMAIKAPSDPPLAIPSVYGVARGLRNNVWNTAPHNESVIPASRALPARGSRSRKAIA